MVLKLEAALAIELAESTPYSVLRRQSAVIAEVVTGFVMGVANRKKLRGHQSSLGDLINPTYFGNGKDLLATRGILLIGTCDKD